LRVSVQKPTTVLHYRQRAESFYRAAQDLDVLDAGAHAPAVGLLSVHGCIALADALLVAAEGERPRGDDHAEAARQLRGWCSAKEIPESGVKHLEWMLKHKTHFSYDDKYVDVQDLQAAKVKMVQFFKWAYETFPEVPGIKETGDA
jgi:hypothetical protein